MVQLNDEIIRRSYKEPLIIHDIVKKIKYWLKDKTTRDFVVLCIGTDRSTGDSLGPLTGTLLERYRLKNFTVYGTLHDPVHAINLAEKIKFINKTHPTSYIIAIDACLGKISSIGDIIAGTGSIRPGAALDKQLPLVGHIHLMGIINVSGFMEHHVLQSTRLSFVFDLAHILSSIIVNLDRRLCMKRSSYEAKKV